MLKIISAGLFGLSFLITPLFSAQTLQQQIGTANDAQNALTAYGQLRELNGNVGYIFEGVTGPTNSRLSGNLIQGIDQVIKRVTLGNQNLQNALFGQQIQVNDGLSTLISPALGSLTTALGNALGTFFSSPSGNLVSQLQQIKTDISSLPSKGTIIGDCLENLGYFDINSFQSLENWSFVTAPWAKDDKTISSVSAVTINNAQNPNAWQITIDNNTYTTGDLTELYPGASSGEMSIQTGDNIVFYGPGNASTIGLIFQYTGIAPIFNLIKKLDNWSFLSPAWELSSVTITSVSNITPNQFVPSVRNFVLTMSDNNTYKSSAQTLPLSIQAGTQIPFYGPGNSNTLAFTLEYTGSNQQITVSNINNLTSLFASSGKLNFDPSSIVLRPPAHSDLSNTISTLSEAIGYVELSGPLTYWSLVAAPWNEIGNTIESVQVNNKKFEITLSNQNTYATGDLTVLYPQTPPDGVHINIMPNTNILFSPISGSGDNFVFQYTKNEIMTTLADLMATFIFGDPGTDPVRLVQPSLTSSIIRVSQLLKLTNPVYSGSNLSQTIGKIRAQVM